jgi:hypothetical protein
MKRTLPITMALVFGLLLATWALAQETDATDRPLGVLRQPVFQCLLERHHPRRRDSPSPTHLTSEACLHPHAPTSR